MATELKKIVLRRGTGTPPTDLAEGELAFQTDTDKLFVGTGLASPNHYKQVANLADMGVTANAGELNILDGATVSTAELNTLDGITANVSELNILDGVTATAAELNILDGVTATAAEINVLDGFTGDVNDLNYAKDLRATGVTDVEFDYLDGVTSNIQTQIDAKAAANLLEWNYVATVVQGDNDEIVISNTTVPYDFSTYDYKFVLEANTTAEDNDTPSIQLNSDSGSGKHSYVYHRAQLTGSVTSTVTSAGEYGAVGTSIFTGVNLGSVSNAYFTQLELEFIISRGRLSITGIFPYMVKGYGNAVSVEGQNTASTTYSGTTTGTFTGGYTGSTTLTSVKITSPIRAGAEDSGIVRIYRRAK